MSRGAEVFCLFVFVHIISGVRSRLALACVRRDGSKSQHKVHQIDQQMIVVVVVVVGIVVDRR